MCEKKKESKDFKERVGTALEMPLDMINGCSRITIIGNRLMYLENYKGIIEYEENVIRLSNDINVFGTKLNIEEINDDDIRIDTYRSSGAGGQHINKTSSAIRITHIPTGIVVQCQNERSQHKNKDKAMQMLKAKLYLLKEQENMEKESDIRGDVKEIGWGSQIRSYVMQPYTLVKDHRTNCEIGNVNSVLDGNIDDFINAYLKWISINS